MFDYRSNGLKLVRPAGWYFILCLLILISLTAIQNWYNQQESDRRDIKAKKEKEVSDSIRKRTYDSSLFEMKKKFDTTQMKTIELLVKYGYKVDSSNNRLVKIVKDSSKTRVILPDNPVLNLCDGTGIMLDSLVKDSFYYKVNICSNDASSTNFDVAFRIVLEDFEKNLIYLGKSPLLRKNTQIPKEKILITGFAISKLIPHNVVYVSMRGTYQNFDQTKTFSVDELYMYTIKDKKFHMAENELRKGINSFINSKI